MATNNKNRIRASCALISDSVFRIIPGIIRKITITTSYPLEHGDDHIIINAVVKNKGEKNSGGVLGLWNGRGAWVRKWGWSRSRLWWSEKLPILVPAHGGK